MLLAFYSSVLDSLHKEFDSLGDVHFGFELPVDVFPYFSIESQSFVLKNPQLKKSSSELKDFNNSETFMVETDGQVFVLQRKPFKIEVVEVKNNGVVTELHEQDYECSGRIVTLHRVFPVGSELIVVYFSKGAEYADRFYQDFALKIYGKDRIELDNLSSLSLPFIWSRMDEMQDQRYSFESKHIKTIYSPSSVTFRKACSVQGDKYDSIALEFTLNGHVTFFRDGGDD